MLTILTANAHLFLTYPFDISRLPVKTCSPKGNSLKQQNFPYNVSLHVSSSVLRTWIEGKIGLTGPSSEFAKLQLFMKDSKVTRQTAYPEFSSEQVTRYCLN